VLSEAKRPLQHLTLHFVVLKPYFLQALEKKYVPSLAEFICLNVDFVAGSPPATTDVTGLTGIWTKRFATAASLLGIENGSIRSQIFQFT